MAVLVVGVAACAGSDEPATEGGGLAELQAAAVERLVTVDNSFGPDADPFDGIEVASVIGGDTGQRLEPAAFDQIDAALQGSATVAFIDDADSRIAELFDQNTLDVAVVSIDDMRVDGSAAELDMRLWCGSVCGVFLTYEAELTDGGWEIVGTAGPIAVS